MQHNEEKIEESKIESELSAFWGEIEKHLPKSIERSALGDKKIFKAIQLAYPQIRKYLYQKAIEDCIGSVPEVYSYPPNSEREELAQQQIRQETLNNLLKLKSK